MQTWQPMEKDNAQNDARRARIAERVVQAVTALREAEAERRKHDGLEREHLIEVNHLNRRILEIGDHLWVLGMQSDAHQIGRHVMKVSLMKDFEAMAVERAVGQDAEFWTQRVDAWRVDTRRSRDPRRRRTGGDYDEWTLVWVDDGFIYRIEQSSSDVHEPMRTAEFSTCTDDVLLVMLNSAGREQEIRRG